MNIFPVTHSTLSVKALENKVLSKYDLELPLECQFFMTGLNDTFLVKTGSDKYILRTYRLGWRSLQDIHYELELLQHLHRQGIAVSIPIAQKDSTLIETIQAPEGERHVVLFSYAPGEQPNYEVDEENKSYLYGKAVAKIHDATDSFRSKYERFKIDLEAIPYFVAIRQIWLTGLHTGNAYDWGRG